MHVPQAIIYKAVVAFQMVAALASQVLALLPSPRLQEHLVATNPVIQEASLTPVAPELLIRFTPAPAALPPHNAAAVQLIPAR